MKNEFMKRAIELSLESVNKGGGPFGCVIVKDEKIVSEGSNKVTSTNDPTAHGEIVAIREACKKINNFRHIKYMNKIGVALSISKLDKTIYNNWL